MKKGVKFFFWACFAAFLLASIPHVAYFFRAYEPAASGPGDVWEWCVSYAIAGSIDLTIFLLSMTVATMQRAHKPRGLVFSVWVFILALAALSWFINYKYAVKFVEMGMISATPVNIAGFNLGDINPLIASMFQVMAIAYTWISDKLLADVQVKTAAELLKEAEEMKLAAEARQQIADIKRQSRVHSLKGLIDAGKDVTNHVRGQSNDGTPSDEQPENDETTNDLTGTFTEPIPVFNRRSIESDRTAEESNQSVFNNQSTGQFPTIEHPALTGLTGRDSVNIEIAAAIIGCQVKYIQTLVKADRLKCAAKSKDRITVASIKSYLAARKPRKQSTVTEPENTEQTSAPERELLIVG